MLGKPRGRQPLNSISRPVFALGFLKLLLLKRRVPKCPNDVEFDARGLGHLVHPPKGLHRFGPRQMREPAIARCPDRSKNFSPAWTAPTVYDQAFRQNSHGLMVCKFSKEGQPVNSLVDVTEVRRQAVR